MSNTISGRDKRTVYPAWKNVENLTDLIPDIRSVELHLNRRYRPLLNMICWWMDDWKTNIPLFLVWTLTTTLYIHFSPLVYIELVDHSSTSTHLWDFFLHGARGGGGPMTIAFYFYYNVYPCSGTEENSTSDVHLIYIASLMTENCNLRIKWSISNMLIKLIIRQGFHNDIDIVNGTHFVPTVLWHLI